MLAPAAWGAVDPACLVDVVASLTNAEAVLLEAIIAAIENNVVNSLPRVRLLLLDIIQIQRDGVGLAK